MSCPMCGNKGKRFCPALKGEICSVCCGSRRVSEINCAQECTYNPFSPERYDAFLAIESSFDQKAMARIVRHYGRDHAQEVMLSMTPQNGDDKANQIIGIGSAAYFLLFFKKDRQGKTLAELWRLGGYDGLTNDERIILDARSRSKATVIEIQRIVDGQAMQCLDLLDPGRGVFTAFDRRTTARTSHFETILTWVDHYPAFSRFGGGGGIIPEGILDSFLDDLRKKAKGVCGNADSESIKHYLSEHFGECVDAMWHLSKEWRRETFRNMDVSQCVGTYGIIGDISKIRTVLAKKPEFRKENPEEDAEQDPAAETYQWVRLGASKAIERSMPSSFRHRNGEEGVGTLGVLRLYPDRLEVEAFSKKKYEFAKKMAAKYFGPEISFLREKIVDVAKQMAERDPYEQDDDDEPEDKAEDVSEKISPDVERRLMTQFHENHYRKFLDEPIPLLRGMTPREASRDRLARFLLLDLMKKHIRNLEAQNKERDFQLSLDWALDELGLPELK